MAQHEILAALLGFPGACVELRRRLVPPGEKQAGARRARSSDCGTLVFSENVRVLADWERDAASVALATGTAYLRILELLGDGYQGVAYGAAGEGEVKLGDFGLESGVGAAAKGDGGLREEGLYLTALREAVETELDTYRHAIASLEQVCARLSLSLLVAPPLSRSVVSARAQLNSHSPLPLAPQHTHATLLPPHSPPPPLASGAPPRSLTSSLTPSTPAAAVFCAAPRAGEAAALCRRARASGLPGC